MLSVRTPNEIDGAFTLFLGRPPALCQSAPMQRDDTSPLFAGGLLILVGFIAGAAFGIAYGQPSLGAIGGVALASLVAVLLWLRRRGR